jgi:hypothetical protein
MIEVQKKFNDVLDNKGEMSFSTSRQYKHHDRNWPAESRRRKVVISMSTINGKGYAKHFKG